MAFYSNRLFPAIYDSVMGMTSLGEPRSRVLSPVRGRILEIGIGTGLNLPHYPGHVERITAIDPNPGMLKKLKLKQPKTRIQIEIACASADALPFPDASFDTVVSTYVLCSVPDRGRTLAEVLRILRPDGQLVFLEHGLSPDPGVAGWQRRMNAIQRRLAVGCQLDVPMSSELETAGFRFEKLHTGYQAGEFKLHGYLYQGIALPRK
jgi:ubiquinone/menaquinone biosynthesis C-methylase UbiE